MVAQFLIVLRIVVAALRHRRAYGYERRKNRKQFDVCGGQTAGYAGGIYLADYQEMSSVGGDDKRPNSIPARDTDFIMNGGTISGNSAHVYGGAICTFPQGGKHVSVEVNDGAISNNQVPDGSGGGIAAFFNTSKLSIKGGSIVDNSALNFGGGIFVYSMKGDKPRWRLAKSRVILRVTAAAYF